jgi:hypothetical protein
MKVLGDLDPQDNCDHLRAKTLNLDDIRRDSVDVTKTREAIACRGWYADQGKIPATDELSAVMR